MTNEPNNTPRVRFLLRGDDMASCPEANAAIAAAVDAGALRNVSLMACAPAFEEAAELLRERQARLGDALNVGLHVTLNAEWETEKWGPVLPPDRVPSLVNENGHFTPFPRDLKERGFPVEEALAEIEAQLARARAAGLRIDYIDEHMGVCHVTGIADAVTEFAARAGVLRPERGGIVRLRELPRPAPPASSVCYAGEFEEADPAERLLDDWDTRLAATEPGAVYLVVTHPGTDEGTMRRFHIAGQPDDGSVARERDAERRALCDPRLHEILAAHRAAPATYRDVLR